MSAPPPVVSEVCKEVTRGEETVAATGKWLGRLVGKILRPGLSFHSVDGVVSLVEAGGGGPDTGDLVRSMMDVLENWGVELVLVNGDNGLATGNGDTVFDMSSSVCLFSLLREGAKGVRKDRSWVERALLPRGDRRTSSIRRLSIPRRLGLSVPGIDSLLNFCSWDAGFGMQRTLRS